VVEETMIKLIYKPASILVGVQGGGLLAGTIFKRIWELAAREDDAPKATDARRGWQEILPAAALQGAVYGLVKTAVDRGAAQGIHKLAGIKRPAGTEGGLTMTSQNQPEGTQQEVPPPHKVPGGPDNPLELGKTAGATCSSAVSRSSRTTGAR
jgi:hypothetical protein